MTFPSDAYDRSKCRSPEDAMLSHDLRCQKCGAPISASDDSPLCERCRDEEAEAEVADEEETDA